MKCKCMTKSRKISEIYDFTFVQNFNLIFKIFDIKLSIKLRQRYNGIVKKMFLKKIFFHSYSQNILIVAIFRCYRIHEINETYYLSLFIILI